MKPLIQPAARTEAAETKDGFIVTWILDRQLCYQWFHTRAEAEAFAALKADEAKKSEG